MAREVVTGRREVGSKAIEPEIFPDPHYDPILSPSAVSVGRGVMRRVIESAIETFLPVIGSGVTEIYRHSHPSLADRIREKWQERITRSVNRMGSTLAAHEITLRDLQSLVTSRAHYEHSGQAGELSFLQTGMWSSLRKIGEGKGDSATMQTLATGLQESEQDVEVIVASLTAARDIMLRQPENIAFSHRLDNVLYGPVGKVGIREGIEQVLAGDATDPATQSIAADLCRRISQFNENVGALAFERRV